jgi:hypothetical protein
MIIRGDDTEQGRHSSLPAWIATIFLCIVLLIALLAAIVLPLASAF